MEGVELSDFMSCISNICVWSIRMFGLYGVLEFSFACLSSVCFE